ncbi:MAG: LPXTG cell wall anchor domain-containing protein [Actinobacteria bacterium]|nr:MAG: LPXTG cell wall anchor domain-containing protein [Actinomycetota bacterium]
MIAKAGTVRVGVKVLDDRGDSSVRRIKVTGLTRPRPERSSGVIRRGPRLDGGTVRAIRRDVSFAPARPAGRTAASTIAPLHAASSSSVSIHDFKFNPSSITIHVGDTVTWTNQDSQQHTATATDGTFNTGTLNHGDVGRFTFPRAGTFNYTCKFHPFMKASVTVVGSSSNGSSSGGSSGSGSSGGSSTGSGSSGGGTGSSGSSSNPLPHTGLQVISLVIAGLALLGSGLVLRRGVRYPTEPPA